MFSKIKSMFKKRKKENEPVRFPEIWEKEKLLKFRDDANEAIFLSQKQIIFLTRKFAETGNNQFLEMVKDNQRYRDQKVEWRKFLEEEHGKDV